MVDDFTFHVVVDCITPLDELDGHHLTRVFVFGQFGYSEVPFPNIRQLRVRRHPAFLPRQFDNFLSQAHVHALVPRRSRTSVYRSMVSSYAMRDIPHDHAEDVCGSSVVRTTLSIPTPAVRPTRTRPHHEILG